MTEAIAQSDATGVPAPLRLLSDRKLTRLVARGDSGAFAVIYKRYADPLYRYCHSILGDPEDARDALQNAMTKALQALPGEKREIALKPWLYRIAHNEALMLIRRRRPHAELDERSAPSVPDAAQEAAVRERLRELQRDMKQLPERQRGALVMRELSRLGYDEIAAALDTTAAVAKQAVYEARIGLQELSEGRAMDCEPARQAISAGDGRVLRARRLRSHLRACDGCRDFEAAIRTRRTDLAALAPALPAAAAASVLRSILQGADGGGGGGLLGLLGSGTGKGLGASAAIKAATVVAVTAGVGFGGLRVSEVVGSSGSDEGNRAALTAADRPLSEHAVAGKAKAPHRSARSKGQRRTKAAPTGASHGPSEVGQGSAGGGGTVGNGPSDSPSDSASPPAGTAHTPPPQAPATPPASPGGSGFGQGVAESVSPVPLPAAATNHPTGPPGGTPPPPSPPVTVPPPPVPVSIPGPPPGVPLGRP